MACFMMSTRWSTASTVRPNLERTRKHRGRAVLAMDRAFFRADRERRGPQRRAKEMMRDSAGNASWPAARDPRYFTVSFFEPAGLPSSITSTS